MLHRFSREELLIGAQGLEKLQRARVAVFGIGGVGGYVVEALARSGVGALDLFDGDTVALTNINRQIIALESTVGRPKVEVARERVLQINPACQVEARQLFFTPENAGEVDFSQYDYVADAIDTVSSKIELLRLCLLQQFWGPSHHSISSFRAARRFSGSVRHSVYSSKPGSPMDTSPLR